MGGVRVNLPFLLSLQYDDPKADLLCYSYHQHLHGPVSGYLYQDCFHCDGKNKYEGNRNHPSQNIKCDFEFDLCLLPNGSGSFYGNTTNCSYLTVEIAGEVKLDPATGKGEVEIDPGENVIIEHYDDGSTKQHANTTTVSIPIKLTVN